MGCTSRIIKFLLFAFNILFVIGGLILLIMGIIKKLDIDASLKTGAPTMAIVVGTLIFFISFMGCCGALKENTCMLKTYGVIVLIFLVLQIVIAVLAFRAVSGDEVKKTLTKGVQKKFDKYNIDTAAKKYFDNLQQALQCCGVNASTDWLPTNKEIPVSCCEKKSNPCTKSIAYKTGCSQAIDDLLRGSLYSIAYVALAFAAPQLVASIFAFCLVNSIKNESRRGSC